MRTGLLTARRERSIRCDSCSVERIRPRTEGRKGTERSRHQNELSFAARCSCMPRSFAAARRVRLTVDVLQLRSHHDRLSRSHRRSRLSGRGRCGGLGRCSRSGRRGRCCGLSGSNGRDRRGASDHRRERGFDCLESRDQLVERALQLRLHVRGKRSEAAGELSLNRLQGREIGRISGALLHLAQH